MTKVSKHCSICKKERRELIATKGVSGMIHYTAVCPECDSSEEGGPTTQRPKPDEEEAEA